MILLKKTDFNSKISGLATTSALIVVENNLVKKTDYNTKISGIEKKITDHNHYKYITTPEFNNLAAGVFDTRLARVNLVTKTDFDIKLKKLVKELL